MARGTITVEPNRDHASPAGIAKLMEHDISEGKFWPHAPLPSYRRLAEQFGVSRRIVANAVHILERGGLVYRRKRQGVFVRRATPAVKSSPATALRCITMITRHAPTLSAHGSHSWLARISGYTQALEHSHVKTRFLTCPEDDPQLEDLLAEEYGLDEQGCILVDVLPAELMGQLIERGIPYVVQYYVPYSSAGLPDHHRVFVNKTGGAAQATKHLLDLGHRRIGFMGVLPGSHPEPRQYEGYCAALRCAGFEHAPNHVLDFGANAKNRALSPERDFLARPDRPTAVLTHNDDTAIAVLEAARDLEIRVPEQLSVVGFNDQQEAASAVPRLTTVSAPIRKNAMMAAQMVMKAAAGEYDAWQTIVLDCHLVVRESTAECPK